jgi:hypothetical protein
MSDGGPLRADLGLIQVEPAKLEGGKAMVHTVEEESDPGCLRVERRWNRTGDPILTIDVRVVHVAMRRLT